VYHSNDLNRILKNSQDCRFRTHGGYMLRIFSLVLLSGAAFAATGTFTFSGTASGTLGSTTFTNAPFTVSAPGDFTTVTCSAGICRLNVAAGAASFTIGGLGSGTFTGTTYFFDNQTSTLLGSPAGVVGFGTTGDLIQIYDSLIGSSALASYNLQSTIGPLGPQAANTAAGIAAFMNADTSRGNLTVPTFTNFTFQVTIAAPPPSTTPAPGSLVLLAIGLSMLAMWKYRSRIFAR
jgi:hypothetical protein